VRSSACASSPNPCFYEQYDDEAAFQAHIATEPFQRIVVGQIVPLLAERSREVMRTFGD